jgi:hypothetical protein
MPVLPSYTPLLCGWHVRIPRVYDLNYVPVWICSPDVLGREWFLNHEQANSRGLSILVASPAGANVISSLLCPRTTRFVCLRRFM